MISVLRCPVCSDPLQPGADNKQLRCINGHSFDRARQGYWNLLLPQRKRSKAPGDNEAMVQARQRFLDQHHYQPIADAVCAIGLHATDSVDNPVILDLGCGEGYYTDHLCHSFVRAERHASLIGLDISKAAIRQACKRDKRITWLVATGADIPLQPDSVDLATLIFARLLPEPTAQVLNKNGLFLVVWPGPDHLRELRELIYTDVRDSDLNPDAQLHELFEPLSMETLRFRFQISDTAQLADLLVMTPHGQRLNQERREALLKIEQLDIQADIRLSLYKKR
ncbi:putative RNA methyltransferase [Nitrincola iocasae]|uniref:Methyltransferase domain-containing protein n=1 Tax=Nitrincola iocasae TaxID=2614693 RepID=A0A5J6LH77_9GAMM|nr:methyltransferase domain-containing protein [Nitrincola iocasae]QEW07662.1 methyltransferase domain-containing protein [Nitrincola iocasae]